MEFLFTFPSNDVEIKDSQYFDKNEVDLLKRQRVCDKTVELSKIALQSEWILPDVKNNRTIKLGDLERKLVACMAPKQIRKLLVELAKFNTNTQQPLWAVNKNWFIPSDIRIAILNLKRGFLQDFSYILLGKVNEMI